MKKLYQVNPQFNFFQPGVGKKADLSLLIVAKNPTQACEFWCEQYNSQFDVNMAPLGAVESSVLKVYFKTNIVVIRDISLDLFEIGSTIQDGVQPWSSFPVTFYEIQRR